MATAEAGLELPIGLTEQKFMQQLARIEARAIKSANSQAKAFVAANDNIGRSFANMSGQARSNLQNVSFQLQDVIVQIQGGTDASRALAQQLPQLLGGFGALGAVLGTVAAFGIPLVSMFINGGKEAKTLDDAIKDLNGSLESYSDAVEAANVPTTELVEKYGAAAGSAQRLLEQLAQIAKLDAASALRDSASAIGQSFEDLPSILALVDAELQSFGEGSSGLETLADELKDSFGLTIDQARELQAILADQQAATTVEQQADAMLRLAEFLGRANQEAGYVNDTLIETNRAAAEGALAANEMAVALEGAAVAAGGVLATTDQLPGSIDAAAASAVNLARALAAAIGAAQSLPGTGFGAPSLDRFGDGSDITRRAGGADLQEQQTFRYDWLAQMEAAEAAARKRGGGRKRKGGAGRKGKEERPFFENVQRDIQDLERQLELIGKTSEEVATMEARWAMLDEAKKRGVTVNETLNGQIEAQAAQVGQLTAELERAEIAQQQFDEAVEGIADAFAGAIIAGESLREGLAQVFKQIASDILSSGIRNALMGQFGGGGGILGGLFGGLFGGGDALTRSLRGAGLRAFDGGGFTGMGSRSGGIDGKGGFPAILHPNETVVDHSRGQGGSNVHVTVGVTVDKSGNLQAYVQDVADRSSARMGAQVNAALPARVQQIQAKPRRR